MSVEGKALATSIREALVLAHQAGYQERAYVDGHLDREGMDPAVKAAQEKALEMWRRFYDYTGEERP